MRMVLSGEPRISEHCEIGSHATQAPYDITSLRDLVYRIGVPCREQVISIWKLSYRVEVSVKS